MRAEEEKEEMMAAFQEEGQIVELRLEAPRQAQVPRSDTGMLQ